MYVQPPFLPHSTKVNHHHWLVCSCIFNFLKKYCQKVMIQLQLRFIFILMLGLTPQKQTCQYDPRMEETPGVAMK
jgi:hypothetical protein